MAVKSPIFLCNKAPACVLNFSYTKHSAWSMRRKAHPVLDFGLRRTPKGPLAVLAEITRALPIFRRQLHPYDGTQRPRSTGIRCRALWTRLRPLLQVMKVSDSTRSGPSCPRTASSARHHRHSGASGISHRIAKRKLERGSASPSTSTRVTSEAHQGAPPAATRRVSPIIESRHPTTWTGTIQSSVLPRNCAHQLVWGDTSLPPTCTPSLSVPGQRSATRLARQP